MQQWKNMYPDEKLLIVSTEIYKYLSRAPEYWFKEGFLNKSSFKDENGRKQNMYSVTKKALDLMYEAFELKVKKRFYITGLKETMQSINTNKKEITLLNLMEAQNESKSDFL